MKKTVKEWLQELPEPYRTKALKYAALEGRENKKVIDMRDALIWAFYWGQTVQGKAYWANLYSKYEHILHT